jgi:hypothetical protein
MAQIISNITAYPKVVTVDESKSLSINEEIARINKVKYNLSVVYFLGVVTLLTTLIL